MRNMKELNNDIVKINERTFKTKPKSMELKDTFDGYEINAKEKKTLKKFLKVHDDCRYMGCNHMFVKIAKGNGIGENLFILCYGCNKFEDISDVTSW